MSNLATHTFVPISRSAGLRDDVATTLIASIINGDVSEGDRLVVQKIAHSLHVSATPVREALVQLSEIGLVDLVPNKGAVCSAFGLKQLHEIFQVRRILEVEAVREAAGHMDTAALENMKREAQRFAGQNPETPEWSEAFMAHDENFHTYITDHCGSARLIHEIQRYNSLMRAIRRYTGNRHNSQLRALGEHIKILDALLAGNADESARAMAVHIDTAAEGVAEIMFPESRSTK